MTTINGGCVFSNFVGDGFCDDEKNNAGCNFDGGDCCGSNVNTEYCIECQCLNDEGSNGGNGTTTSSLTTNSGGCAIPDWIGDGYCDDETNNDGCNFDGGDCCGSNVNTEYCTECQCHE